MPMQGSLSIERMCQLAGSAVPASTDPCKTGSRGRRAWKCDRQFSGSALEHRRRYGYRRVTAELRRRGMRVNHKRVARIMREDNLLAVQPKQFVTTTDSNHALEIYLNLARRMTLTGH